MRDLLRRMMVWLFPPHDPNADAALDGGPGPEPEPWLSPDAVVDDDGQLVAGMRITRLLESDVHEGVSRCRCQLTRTRSR